MLRLINKAKNAHTKGISKNTISTNAISSNGIPTYAIFLLYIENVEALQESQTFIH